MDDFEQRSKITIEDCQVTMLGKLRAGIESAERVQMFLETGKCQLAGKIECRPGAKGMATSRTLMGHHAADLSDKFNDLQRTASTGLDNVAGVKKKWDDFDAELSELRIRIQTLVDRSQAAVANAEKLLAQNERSIQQMSETLGTQEVQLRELERRANSQRGDRDGLLFFTGVSAIAAFLFPPVLLIAAPLATGTIAVQSEIKTLQGQGASLQEAVVEARHLWSRSEVPGQGNDSTQAVVEERLRMFYKLKASADEFGAWTSELTAEIDAMKLVSHSEKALRGAVQRIMDNPDGAGPVRNPIQLLALVAAHDQYHIAGPRANHACG
ncbi:hypothetical protein DL766_003607 [Monosporascus sp. MC13-8B]|uniref:Fungal N-terminal domain-containing protein n=1 Tax=Monosporascus cannonballus TaxID=155416 RepID=A0ABY0HDK8_9PEZI|nr:hypothetical protein DL762_003345 [Monosporascus cannonballus]RYP33175.1 hypothetical protein DL766_003607 [Monosporascus sp. MC13-8B]